MTTAQSPSLDPEVEGRRRHYGHFYGLTPLPEQPLLLVWGNCQGESFRLLLGEEPGTALADGELASVRVPPAFELTADEVPLLHRLVARARVLVSQPIPDDYRGMPVGTGQLAALLPEGAELVRVPVLYCTSRFPWQTTLRHWKAAPGAAERPGEDPPLVPYHDLRTLVEAHGRLTGAEVAVRAVAACGAGTRLPVDPASLQEAAEESVGLLAHREKVRGLLPVSDLVAAERGVGFHAVNHPDNPLLLAAAQRVAEEIGRRTGLCPEAALPADGRTLLGGIRTPVEEQVVEALGLDCEPRPEWTIGGETVLDAVVRQTHLDWYLSNPACVAAGMERFAARIRLLRMLP
ncbi:WcbI family polysaccharide biosynthesis putative acetyltransferase [Micrococcus lylae]|uniref:Polysaccharide biosynthesis enzyme WcbI domain-containing protein n=1 Tax=Micrococcus lylae TaxID=1273 RepID=A0ABY2K1Y1_9MICC|nr:WcbI family polysaccharide biosynthesis putative acetyltransferase [Micrococcus lylae]TFH98824.1 hypothetical protein E4A49_07615 [Micrococcus lylae]